MAKEVEETVAGKAAEPKKTVAKKPAAEKTAAKEKAVAEKKAAPYTISAPLLNIREKATLSSRIMGTIEGGQTVRIASITPSGFGKLADSDGYIKIEFAEKAIND